MLLQSRPLFDNLADARFFATPPEWNPIVGAIDRRLNLLVHGQRGLGKTTLLRQVQRTLRESGEDITFVDANAVDGAIELTTRIRDVLRGRPSAASAAAGTVAAAFSSTPNPVAGASRALATLLDEIAQAKPTIVLLDASSSGVAIYELFGRMRDVLWQQHHRWVVAIDETDRPTVLKPPADAFFDVVIKLRPWPTTDLAQMLTRRGGDEEGALPKQLAINAAAGANGNPREALRAVSDALVRERDPSNLLNERAQLLQEATKLGRAPAMLMGELLDRGAASPSDGDLQAALGVSRSRLTQLMRKLLDAQLAIADVERADGPGRPRTVYRPALDR